MNRFDNDTICMLGWFGLGFAILILIGTMFQTSAENDAALRKHMIEKGFTPAEVGCSVDRIAYNCILAKK